MNLDRVTITGADDSVRPSELLALSVRYPFVEWGVLVHAKGACPRFPSEDWLKELHLLQSSLRTRDELPPMKLSLHVCGRWVRDLLVGVDSLPARIEDDFSRIQLNFHAENARCEPAKFAKALAAYELHEIIFQIDGANGNRHLDALLKECKDFETVPLFDISGGAGILPDEWPQPFDPGVYHGYAGGLGPENLEDQIPRIAQAAGGCRFWIDMETRVRSEDDRQFDLAKVQRCLEIADSFVTKVPA